MHTVELLEEAIEAAKRLGYNIRQEWLDGSGGGACEFGGKRWLFVDLALNADEQLDQAIAALRADQAIDRLSVSPALGKLLQLPKAA